MNAFLSSLGLLYPKAFRAKRNDTKIGTGKGESSGRKTIENGNDMPRLSNNQSPANQTLRSVLAKEPSIDSAPPSIAKIKALSRSERRERKYDDGSISLSDLAFSMEWEEETVRFEGWPSELELH